MRKGADPLDPIPEPPSWAVARGLPKPEDGERFRAYCRRLGIPEHDIEWLLEELTERQAPVVNARLASYILTQAPHLFERARSHEGRYS